MDASVVGGSSAPGVRSLESLLKTKKLGATLFPLAVVAVVALMVIPIPTVVLDVLLACNLGVAILMLLAALNVSKALDLASFPSLLLIATLARLSLNVSTSRLILSQGDAGEVIKAFGSFVIGGSLVVGLVVFFILVVIQFVVITNGATRVAEVAARFTLDAMPGKQMAIDADLNAGIIDEEEARKRREEVTAEADFYGAMDGASKFVKGDAIAAVIITAVNLIGGLLIGVVQRGQNIGDAVNTYSLLTVGDGLISQIPALLVSISSGLIITRAASANDLGSDVTRQFARQHRALRTGGLAMMVFAIAPGIPKLPFLMVGGAAYLVGRRLAAAEAAMAAAPPVIEMTPVDESDDLARVLRNEPLSLELAVDLVDLVDPAAHGDLLDRVQALRRRIVEELGIVIPPVRTRDNVELPLGSYLVRIHGVEAGSGQAPAGRFLVIADDLSVYPGQEVFEPVFGLPAKWVGAEHRAAAEASGATVVDRASVVTTHLAEIAREHAAELLSRQDVKALVDLVKEHDPAVVEDLLSCGISLAEVQQVLHQLLAEQVPIRDLSRILEVISERSRVTRDLEIITEAVRRSLGPTICASRSRDGRLAVITLDPMIEQGLLGSVQHAENGSFMAIEPDVAQRVGGALGTMLRQAEHQGYEPALVCAPALRPAMRSFASRVVPRMPVLSYDELSDHLVIDDLGAVTLDHA
ncbi:MAG: flagellar biosynthesis protein FlhA [Microthrixaceae bacterium]